MAKESYQEEFTADDQKAMEEMRKADSAPVEEIPVEEIIDEPAIAAPAIEEKEPKEPKNTMVPHAALHEEREARKAAEKQARELSEQFARMDERLKIMQQVPPEPKQAIPNPDIDALGALKHTQRELQLLQQQQAQQAAQQRQADNARQITANAAALERQFIAQNPEYNEASNFLINSRLQELKAFGHSDEQAYHALEQEKLALVMQAQQTGRNPAEIVFNLAKTRGYASKLPANDPNKLENIAAAQKANTSLSSASGVSSGSNRMPTGKEIATMDDESFAKWEKTLTKAQRLAYFGN